MPGFHNVQIPFKRILTLRNLNIETLEIGILFSAFQSIPKMIRRAICVR